ncbi:MAG: phosphatidylserine/phosphatidylglycerophosphate/cardiolipin synthase family protein [Candidatus Binatia bacterium]
MLLAVVMSGVPATHAAPMLLLDAQIAAHPGQSGVYVLDSSEEALIARAWLADHAERTIDVQYFIWSTDNIGTLAAEALLRAAERGVHVRVIVDDFMMDVPDRSLLALAAHPAIDIRIYNPNTSVGVSLARRAWNVLTDLRGVNQRMHDKTFLVDGKVAITGGRNMAAEYYDYHHDYNFRDRDVLLAGDVMESIQASFARFWTSDLTVPVETLYDSSWPLEEQLQVDDEEARRAYRDLHAYATSPENFAPTVRAAIASASTAFPRLADEATWGKVEFLSDLPGKNDETWRLGGGGRSTQALAALVDEATDRIVIQSPYLVMSDRAFELFRKAIARGVKVRISTNSLAATDNLQAFAGYRNQREELLKMGLVVFEYRPDAQSQREARARELVGELPAAGNPTPVFGMHAKSMVVDSRVAYIGTFNLDPRSENLNTEAGVVIHDEKLARRVEALIEEDMKAGNSWNAATDDPDRYVPPSKLRWAQFWQWMPMRPLL